MDAVFWPLATMSHMAAVWTVTVVTLHRYIAVCLPHRAVKFVNLRIARLQASISVDCSVRHRTYNQAVVGLGASINDVMLRGRKGVYVIVTTCDVEKKRGGLKLV